MHGGRPGEGLLPSVTGTHVPVSPGNTLTDTHAPKQCLIWAPTAMERTHRIHLPRGLGLRQGCSQEFLPCHLFLEDPVRWCRWVALLPGVLPTRFCPHGGLTPDADSLYSSVAMLTAPFPCSRKVRAACSLSSSFRGNTCVVQTELLWPQTFPHSAGEGECAEARK